MAEKNLTLDWIKISSSRSPASFVKARKDEPGWSKGKTTDRITVVIETNENDGKGGEILRFQTRKSGKKAKVERSQGDDI